MKSRVEDAVRTEGFPSDMEWKKYVFDKEELCQAVIEGDIEGLVRRVLNPVYGDMPNFAELVLFTVLSLRSGIAETIRRTDAHEMCVLSNHTQIVRDGKLRKELDRMTNSPKYWKGEGSALGGDNT